MSLKLDDFEFMKRPERGTEDIRAIYEIEVFNRRSIVELDIPGSPGNILQDMGTGNVLICISGEMLGKNALTNLESLWAKYESNKSYPFSSDLAIVPDMDEVLIQEFDFCEVSGRMNRYTYNIKLVEHEMG